MARVHEEETTADQIDLQNVSIFDLICWQAERRPAAIAVRWGTVTLSYAQLVNRCREVAFSLKSRHFDRQQPIGVLLDRSCDLVVALVSLLSAGIPYVPLDPVHPPERLQRIIDDAGVGNVLATRSFLHLLPEQTNALLLDELRDRGEVVRTEASPDDLAYIIYTSGSTGSPKGVMVRYGGLINEFFSMLRLLRIKPSDKVLGLASISFDIATLELLLPLTAGAEVMLTGRETAADGQRLASLLDECGVTVLQATPLTWRLLREAGWLQRRRLRIALCGGEMMTSEMAADLMRVAESGFNVYGPTEITVWATAQPLGLGETDIGRPLANTTCYILDRNAELAPLGVFGELYIGGHGLARGYVKAPALTADRFLPNPWSETPGGRLYRTGDRARWRDNGTLEYQGRLDNQIKLRGYRIELGEIESALCRHPHVQLAAVLLQSKPGQEKELTAYLTASGGQVVSGSQLRDFLRQELPEYMIPGRFIKMQVMPSTVSGKIDRQALAKLDLPWQDDEISQSVALTPIEEVLVGIWSSLLRVAGLQSDSNFFDLGGHSLLAMQMMSRVRQVMQVELPLRKAFEFPMLGQLAAEIEAASAGQRFTEPLIASAREPQMRPALAQQRLWFLDRLAPGSPLYNEFLAVRLNGALSKEALEGALCAIVQRHEVLRTVFTETNGYPMVSFRDGSHVTLPLIDLRNLDPDAQRDACEAICSQEASRPFRLDEGPLLRANLVQHGDHLHTLLVAVHHIVCDGWSVRILAHELSVFYTAFLTGAPPLLEPLSVQYQDYAIWQQRQLESDRLMMQEGYWRQHLRGIAPLRLPSDFHAGPPSLVGPGATIPVLVPAEVAKSLTSSSRVHNVTLFMTLLAAYQIVLSSWTGSPDICVGTDISGRHVSELEPLAGFFVNQLPLRSRVEPGFTFQHLLDATRHACLEAYANQDAPFERVVEALHLSGSSTFPLFEAKIVLQNFTEIEIKLGSMEASILPFANEQARLPLVLMVHRDGDSLRANFTYRCDLFAAQTISCLAEHFLRIVTEAAFDSSTTIARLAEPLNSALFANRKLHQQISSRERSARWHALLSQKPASLIAEAGRS